MILGKSSQIINKQNKAKPRICAPFADAPEPGVYRTKVVLFVGEALGRELVAVEDLHLPVVPSRSDGLLALA